MKTPIILLLFTLTISLNAQKKTYSVSPPGTVINHQAASTGEFVASPGIVIHDNGYYYVSHDYSSIKGGDNGNVHHAEVWVSKDKGKTWTSIAKMDNFFWPSIFSLNGDLYILGVTKAFGDIVIYKSEDDGKTWTQPIDSKSGLLANDGRYHTSPMKPLVYQGKIWKAMEVAPVKREFQSFLMYADINADLLNAASWKYTEKIPYETSWYNGSFKAWLEGNVVVNPEGELVNILRCQFNDNLVMNKVARITYDISTDEYNFNEKEGFIDLPGGTGKKFVIQYDEKTKKYWAMSNWVQPSDLRHLENLNGEGKLRNCLSLISSENLEDWIIERVIAYHPSYKNHAFQYPDWSFDGEDIVVVSRTAYEDGVGGAANHHDANFITFHRIHDFRNSLNK